MSELAEQLKSIIDKHGMDDTILALGEACVAAGDDRIAMGNQAEGDAYKELGQMLMEMNVD